MSKEGLENLRYAIVEKAIRDYRALLEGTMLPSSTCNIEELERFFRSEWYKLLCDYDGERIMKEIREQVKK